MSLENLGNYFTISQFKTKQLPKIGDLLKTSDGMTATQVLCASCSSRFFYVYLEKDESADMKKCRSVD